MATAHVAGAAVLYKSHYGDAPWQEIRDRMVGNPTCGVVRNNPAGTPNLLLFERLTGKPSAGST